MKGSLKRIGALFYARTLEFVRDRAALVWNLLFPLLLVIGFSLIFSGPPKPLVQIGVVGELPATYAPLRAVMLEGAGWQEVCLLYTSDAADEARV